MTKDRNGEDCQGQARVAVGGIRVAHKDSMRMWVTRHLVPWRCRCQDPACDGLLLCQMWPLEDTGWRGLGDPCNIFHNGVWLFNYIWFFFKFWVKKALKGGWIRSDILRAGELSLVFFHLQLSACRHGNKAARLHNAENCLFRLLFNFVFGNSFTYTKAAHPQKK